MYDIYINKYENTILELSAALNDENLNDENTAKKRTRTTKRTTKRATRKTRRKGTTKRI